MNVDVLHYLESYYLSNPCRLLDKLIHYQAVKTFSAVTSATKLYQGGEEGRTWDRKGMLSMGLMAMLSGPVIFMGMGVVIATGWAIFMCAVVGILTEARFTGPVMVTGCCRLTGDVMLTVLVAMFI